MSDIKEDLPQESEEKEEFIEETPAIKEFLGDEVKEEEPEKPEEKPEGKEEAEEEPKGEPKEEVKSEPIDIEKITQEIKDAAREEVKSEILKSLEITDKQKEAATEAGFKFEWEKRGEDHPKDWKEQAEGVKAYMEFVESENTKMKEKETSEFKAKEEERVLKINSKWDEELDYLETENLIPRVAPDIKKKISEGKALSSEERKDAGLAARAELFTAMYELNKDVPDNEPSKVSDLVHVYHRVYAKKSKTPAGASAPVSGGSAPLDVEEKELSYDQLHGLEFEDLVKF